MRARRLFFSFIVTTVLILGQIGCNSSEEPQNIVFFISDGCGPASFSLARSFQKRTGGSERLFVDDLRKGAVTTHSGNRGVTDSAAGATAFACGVKTYNGAIGVDMDTLAVATILEAAETRGMNTALVTTAEISHATPAGFSSHVKIRSMQTEIAVQQLSKGIELLVGGGRRHYLPKEEGGVRTDGRNLFQEADSAGYHLAQDRDGFLALDTLPALALFTRGHMSYEIDRTDAEPSIAEMTTKALELLGGADKPFFIMIEAGRIDHAGHSDDPATHLREVLAYDEAMRAAVEFARKDGKTLIVGTSDHETGGLALGKRSPLPTHGYIYNPEKLAGVTSSFERLSRDMMAEGMRGATNKELIEWFRSQIRTRFQIQGLPERTATALSVGMDTLRATRKGDLILDTMYRFLSDSTSAHANIGWSTSGHTAVDVPLFAFGPGSGQFSGTLDNTQMAIRLAELMHVDLAAETARLRAE